MSVVWLLVAIGVLCLAQAWLFARAGPLKIGYKRTFSTSEAYEGEEIELVEVISNAKLLPLPWLRVESYISQNLQFHGQSDLTVSGGRYHRSLFFLPGYRRITRRHKVKCLKRGYYKLESVNLSVGDLVGIKHASGSRAVQAEVTVYPRLFDIGEMPTESLRWQGDVVVRRYIQSDPYLVNGIRDYAAGDRQKDIHWAATARRGHLQVKTHDFTASPRVMMVVNVQRDAGQWGELGEQEAEVIERGISYAASLAAWAVSLGLEAGMTTNGDIDGLQEPLYIEPAGGNDQLRSILGALAHLRIHRKLTLPTLLEQVEAMLPGGMDFAVVSNYWDETLEMHAGRLRALGNTVTYLPIPQAGKEQAAS